MNHKAKMTAAQVEALLVGAFPDWPSTGISIEEVGFCRARLRMQVTERALRPGGTVSGPVMFMLCDTAFYVAVLASIGPQALAVTTNININFLRKPAPADLIADCTLLKLGKRLAVGDVKIFSGEEDAPVAHATGTYSIPPQ